MRALCLTLALAVPALAGTPAIPVTPELLARWGISVEAYRSMPPEKKAALQQDLSAGEEIRLARVELIRRIRPSDWSSYVDPKGFVTPEGLRLIEAYEAGIKTKGLPVPVNLTLERLDGLPLTEQDLAKSRILMDKLFDGAATLEPGRAPAGTKIVMDARVSNETVHSVTMTLPEKGLVLEVGQLGTSGRSPLLRPSPYANLTKHSEGEGKLADYRVRAQIGYVDMKARYFSTGPDPRVQRMLDLGQELGLDPAAVREWKNHLIYDDSYQAQGLVVASLMAQLGRAYNLFGPVDIAWAATSLTKIYHLAPNQAFDESAGLRVKLPGEDLFFGLFGGVTQNLSPVSGRLYQEFMTGGQAKADFHWENSPHATASLWGKMPGVDDMRFSASAGRRYNEHTTVTQGELALLSNLRRMPVAVRVSHKQEDGKEIGFERQTSRIQLEGEVAENVTAFMAYEKDAVKYGNADVKSEGVWAGARWDFGAGKARLTVDHLFGQGYGKDSPLAPYMPDAARAVTELLAAGVEAAAEAEELFLGMLQGATQAELDALINKLSYGLSKLSGSDVANLLGAMENLSDSQKAWLSDFLTRTFPEGSLREEEIRRILQDNFGAIPELDRLELLGDMKGKIADAVELTRLLANPEVWEAAAIAAGRTALIKGLAEDLEIDIPVIDKTITLKTRAPALIAAMGALNSRLSPLAPVKPEEASAWLTAEAASELGLDRGSSTDDIADALLDRASERFVTAVTAKIDEAVDGFFAEGGVYDPNKAAAAILSQVPPLSAAALRELYGPNLESLLPPAGTAPDEVKKYLHGRLTGDVLAALRAKLGPAAAQAAGELAAWAGEIVSREINLTTIHLMLAAEELERMTVDRGRKASDLGVDMLRNSFTRLDARKRRELADRLTGARRKAQGEQAAADDKLMRKLETVGRARLQAIQFDPAWPQGLSVEVPEGQLAPILASYGDSAFFDALQAMARKRTALGKTAPLVLDFKYDPEAAFGLSTTVEKDGRQGFTLGPAKSSQEAAARMSWLPDFLK